MKTGIELIAEERQRQIEQLGHTPVRDSAYKKGTLAMAAICYATVGASGPTVRQALRKNAENGQAPKFWPWNVKHWKPGADESLPSRIRELTKAGALIAAEIDNLNRLHGREESPCCHVATYEVDDDASEKTDFVCTECGQLVDTVWWDEEKQ